MTEHEGTPEGAGEPALRVFINYRREDTAADARLVYERLAQRFGSENVFLDVVDLQPGTSWLDAIKSRGGSSGAFVVLIGPRWLASMIARAEGQLENPNPDIVKMEVELALARDSGVEVVPVLVGDATMPRPDRLPRSIRRLSELHAVELRHTRFDEDIGYLIAALEVIPRRAEAPDSPDRAQASPATAPRPSSSPPSSTSAPPGPRTPRALAEDALPGPDQRHYEIVARYMFDEGTVVPVLGARVYGSLPDADEIAADLARRFELDPDPPALPRVAQQVYVSSGRPDLLRTLRRILASEREPSNVHRFLARFPKQLERLGLPPRYQMIVTTNYDSTLERAFDEENEPYDLAVYVGAGEDRGKFVHLPFDREPELISVPNRYNRFPIDDFGELQRTLIVKIHGGMAGGVDGDRWREAFVVTEDQYIDYLSAAPIESLVPVQILAKLTESHCLFLGYTMRDWNLRVFLKRIWRGEPLGSRSWAVERESDALEKDFWKGAQVESFRAPLDAYVEQLSRHMVARGAARA